MAAYIQKWVYTLWLLPLLGEREQKRHTESERGREKERTRERERARERARARAREGERVKERDREREREPHIFDRGSLYAVVAANPVCEK